MATSSDEAVDAGAGREEHGVTARTVLVLLLSSTAGCVDAIGYLLIRAFTANMTGNTVLLGLSLGQVESEIAVRAAVALAAFVLGVAVGGASTRFGRRDKLWPPAVTITLAIECAALGAFAAAWQLGETGYPLLGSAAFAMGLQSAAVRSLDLPGVATTYITGTMTTLVSGLVGHLRPSGPPERALKERVSPHRGPVLLASVWAVYIAGAVAGGLGESVLGAAIGVLPVTLVLVVVIVAAVRYRAR